MFENMLVIVIIVTIFWVGAFAYYFFLSRQQADIAEDIEKLQKQLDSTPQND
jgi:Tfp pilus assembly protein PilO